MDLAESTERTYRLAISVSQGPRRLLASVLRRVLVNWTWFLRPAPIEVTLHVRHCDPGQSPRRPWSGNNNKRNAVNKKTYHCQEHAGSAERVSITRDGSVSCITQLSLLNAEASIDAV